MQSSDFDEDVYKNWFRRPALFTACAWFWLAAAGKVLIPAVMNGLLALLHRLIPFFSVDLGGTAVNLLYQGFAIALPVLLYRKNHPGVEQSMRLTRVNPAAIGLAVLAGVSAVPVAGRLSVWWAMLIQTAGGRLTAGTVVASSSGELVLMLIVSAVIPAVCEELLFRGGILGAWERRGRDRALVASSLLFALLHGSIQGLPVQLVMGFALGLVVQWTDSLYAGVGFHTVFNALTLILAWLSGDSAVGSDVRLAVEASAGLGRYALETAALAAMFAGVMLALRQIMRARGPKKADRPVDLSPMDWRESVVLLAGLLTAAVIYASDFLRICGVM